MTGSTWIRMESGFLPKPSKMLPSDASQQPTIKEQEEMWEHNRLSHLDLHLAQDHHKTIHRQAMTSGWCHRQHERQPYTEGPSQRRPSYAQVLSQQTSSAAAAQELSISDVGEIRRLLSLLCNKMLNWNLQWLIIVIIFIIHCSYCYYIIIIIIIFSHCSQLTILISLITFLLALLLLLPSYFLFCFNIYFIHTFFFFFGFASR